MISDVYDHYIKKHLIYVFVSFSNLCCGQIKTCKKLESISGRIKLQIATIAADLSNEEKLAKLYRISSSNAMRTLQQEDGNDDEDEEKVYDLIQNVVATLRKGPSAQNERKKTEFFRSLGERAKSLQSRSADAPAADRALPPRVRQFRDYATKLDAESEEWRAMMAARQERYRKARADKLAVLKGARKLTEEEDSRHLAPEVRQMLTSAPDGVAHMARDAIQCCREIHVIDLKFDIAG